MIIGVPIFPGPIARLRNAYIRHFPKTFAKSGSGHLQTFSLKTIRALLREHGQFEEQSVRGFRVLSGGRTRALEIPAGGGNGTPGWAAGFPVCASSLQFRLVCSGRRTVGAADHQGRATDLRDDQSESAAEPSARAAGRRAGLRRWPRESRPAVSATWFVCVGEEVRDGVERRSKLDDLLVFEAGVRAGLEVGVVGPAFLFHQRFWRR
ncbi:MAG: hypothetical protein U5Q16_16060 [Gammaproteobacteria bacterium]|nr:hypothetical protein [Gammaproteobacteria bacterium]